MRTRLVTIGPQALEGVLSKPDRARGLVIFAHGSGSSRTSPRNKAVARALNEAGLATLLFDLLTTAEAEDRRNVFDVGRLAARLTDAVHWAKSEPELHHLPVGLFGASTGAAAALVAAARESDDIRAVVSRGGRPDLAGELLPLVQAPTLLIVGSDDAGVRELNEEALNELTAEKQLALVPGATHLFEELGALEIVEQLAAHWFLAHLGGSGGKRRT